LQRLQHRGALHLRKCLSVNNSVPPSLPKNCTAFRGHPYPCMRMAINDSKRLSPERTVLNLTVSGVGSALAFYHGVDTPCAQHPSFHHTFHKQHTPHRVESNPTEGHPSACSADLRCGSCSLADASAIQHGTTATVVVRKKSKSIAPADKCHPPDMNPVAQLLISGMLTLTIWWMHKSSPQGTTQHIYLACLAGPS